MGDMSALVAADSNGTYVLQLAQLVAVRVEVDNVKKACIWHCELPENFAHAALCGACIL